MKDMPLRAAFRLGVFIGRTMDTPECTFDRLDCSSEILFQCSHCGHLITDPNCNFCRHCGAKKIKQGVQHD